MVGVNGIGIADVDDENDFVFCCLPASLGDSCAVLTFELILRDGYCFSCFNAGFSSYS